MLEIPKAPATNGNELAGRYNLVANYGKWWSRSELERPGKKRMVGQRLDAIRPVNFWDQEGVYVLLNGRDAHYVGISKTLGGRLHEHTLDHLKGDWDGFHWFGFRPVASNPSAKGF